MLIQSTFRQSAAPRQAGAATIYVDNAEIYAEGTAAGQLYLVEFGAVRLCRLTADGRRQISAFHFAGDVFGFEADTHHHFSAESIGSSGIRVVDIDGPGDKLLTLALRNLSRAQEHLVVLGRQHACEKMAAFLLDLAERQDSDDLIDLPMQRNDIADYLGLTFETVSRVLGRLKERRLIRLQSTRRIELLDVPALQTLCA